MPRKRAVDNGHETNRNARIDPLVVDGDSVSVSSVFELSSGSSRESAACAALRQFDARADGWLRFIPSGDGKQCYAKWKFTQGQHAGKYVMWAGPAGDVLGAMVGLALKLLDVDDGAVRPANDTFYDPR